MQRKEFCDEENLLSQKKKTRKEARHVAWSLRLQSLPEPVEEVFKRIEGAAEDASSQASCTTCRDW